MAKEAAPSCDSIIRSINSHEFSPVYLLMGEEPYFIDLIVDALDRNVLNESEKDFNCMDLYCTADTDVNDIIGMARRFPMMAEHQLIFVKEAQNLKKLDDLAVYVQSPLKSTIFVICYKNGNIDKRKKLYSLAGKVGTVYESQKLKDSALPSFIEKYLKDYKGVTMDNSAKEILSQFVGPDLCRLTGELDKLCVTLPEGQKKITAEHVETNIGISREYNTFELKNAIVARDVYKANQIMCFLKENAKANPPIMIVSLLFSFFANLMLAHYSPDKSSEGIKKHLEFHNSWQVNDYLTAMRIYTPRKTMEIISKLRTVDAMLKGQGKGDSPDYEIMQELLYFILH